MLEGLGTSKLEPSLRPSNRPIRLVDALSAGLFDETDRALYLDKSLDGKRATLRFPCVSTAISKKFNKKSSRSAKEKNLSEKRWRERERKSER